MLDREEIIQDNKSVYDSIAGHFSNTRQLLWPDLIFILDFVRDSDSILDIGCGNGRLYQLFTDKSTEFTGDSKPKSINFFGQDISSELIKLAKINYPDGVFEVSDMRNMSYTDNTFDLVISLVAFHHLPDYESQLEAMREMARVTKIGGKIILINWNAHSDWVKRKLERGDYREIGTGLFEVPWKDQTGVIIGRRVYYSFRPEEIVTLAKSTGLQVVEQYYLRHSERVDVKVGMNLVSIIDKN